MPGPAQIVIEFGGVDVRTSEGIGETFYLNSVTDLTAALATALAYAEWRREWLARGLFIVAVRASMIQTPPVSDSVPLTLEGNLTLTSGDQDRDNLASGLLFRCKDQSGTARGNRFFRGFADVFTDYDAAGQEIIYPAVDEFKTSLLTKTTTLGLALKALSRDAAVTFPKIVTAVTLDGATLTGVTATGAGAQAGYDVGERINITGARGSRASVVNGVYRILNKVGDVLSLWPNKTVPQGFVYTPSSARTNLRVPSYPTITQALFVRFGTHQVGNARNRRRSRKRRV